MFSKILVPLDGSELAAKVLPHVVELAKTFNSQVTLLHVCHTEAFAVGEAAPAVVETAPVAEKKACEAFLSKVANDLKGQGVNVGFACVEGVPAREIIGYADKNGMDLIVMATHGAGEVAWVLGSTAEKVVTHATVPVLLYRVIEVKPPALKEEYFLGA
jgi:nucleotide-binding universal stress UspA family protein|uniref:Universal stress protein n=1 Tax=Desulfobacca acetoxidans TaxID=60893 RepID=A0A7C3WS75_9BACT